MEPTFSSDLDNMKKIEVCMLKKKQNHFRKNILYLYYLHTLSFLQISIGFFLRGLSIYF